MEDNTPPGTASDTLTMAFPAALADDVRAVQAVMPPTRYGPVQPFDVSVDGESVAIPSRIYHPEPAQAVDQTLTPRQAVILGCLYTRHHDGYVRQRRIEQVMKIPEPWVAPFVIQLVGEYVLETLITIGRGLAEVNVADANHRALYGRFLAANPDFLARTERRVVSYWNCYYRPDYPDFQRYPGNDLINQLYAMAQDHSDRRWPRNSPAHIPQIHGQR